MRDLWIHSKICVTLAWASVKLISKTKTIKDLELLKTTKKSMKNEPYFAFEVCCYCGFFVAILTEFYILHTFSSNIQWVFQFNKYQYKQLNVSFFVKGRLALWILIFLFKISPLYSNFFNQSIYVPPTCKKVLGETTVKIILQQRQLGRFQGPSTSTYSKFWLEK